MEQFLCSQERNGRDEGRREIKHYIFDNNLHKWRFNNKINNFGIINKEDQIPCACSNKEKNRIKELKNTRNYRDNIQIMDRCSDTKLKWAMNNDFIDINSLYNECIYRQLQQLLFVTKVNASYFNFGGWSFLLSANFLLFHYASFLLFNYASFLLFNSASFLLSSSASFLLSSHTFQHSPSSWSIHITNVQLA